MLRSNDMSRSSEQRRGLAMTEEQMDCLRSDVDYPTRMKTKSSSIDRSVEDDMELRRDELLLMSTVNEHTATS